MALKGAKFTTPAAQATASSGPAASSPAAMLAGSAISRRTSPDFEPAATISWRGPSSATTARPSTPLAPTTRMRNRGASDIAGLPRRNGRDPSGSAPPRAKPKIDRRAPARARVASLACRDIRAGEGGPASGEGDVSIGRETRAHSRRRLSARRFHHRRRQGSGNGAGAARRRPGARSATGRRSAFAPAPNSSSRSRR